MWRKIISIILVEVMILSQAGMLGIGISFADENFLQTDWTGGESSQTAMHPTNKTGWNKYSSKDSHITTNFPCKAYMTTDVLSVTDTSDTDFLKGTRDSNVILSGTGNSAYLTLDPTLTDPFVKSCGVKEGARVVAGGQRQPVNGKGYFVQATVLDGVDNRMRVAQEEIFGPVLAVIPFDDAEDAVRKANDIPFGLAAGVWTRDVRKAHAVARRLRAGTVWVNMYNFYDPGMPFGGTKASGFGSDLGMECLLGYTQVMSVWMNLE